MRVFGIIGWSGGGKTTLIKSLIPKIVRRGLSISTLKHAHHEFDIDKPGKDSFEHRNSGAQEVLISSSKRWALIHENRGQAELSLNQLLSKISPVDLVLVEGFKNSQHSKIEVYRKSNKKPLLQPNDPVVCAIASDVLLPSVSVPVFQIDNTEKIVEFILYETGLKNRL